MLLAFVFKTESGILLPDRSDVDVHGLRLEVIADSQFLCDIVDLCANQKMMNAITARRISFILAVSK